MSCDVQASGSIRVGACTLGPGHERSASEVISDATITSKVKTALLAEEDVKSMDIKVETFNGSVQLGGFVDSQWQSDQAAEVAVSVNGVQQLTNDLIHTTG